MKIWKWVRLDTTLSINRMLIASFGGVEGVRDTGLLESALARPENLATYGKPTVFDLAAAYAYGIISNHPFLDGNKRTSLLVVFTFLKINGYKTVASEAEAYAAILALAQKEIDEAIFATFLEHNTKRI